MSTTYKILGFMVEILYLLLLLNSDRHPDIFDIIHLKQAYI